MYLIDRAMSVSSSLDLAKVAANAAGEKLGSDILILDMSQICVYTDYFVIVSGKTARHTKQMSEEIQKKMKEAGGKLNRVEGLVEGSWILLDYRDVIVHVFTQEARHFYKLENLWKDVPRLELKACPERSRRDEELKS